MTKRPFQTIIPTHEVEAFTITAGTHNKDNPVVIVINIETYIQPTTSTYDIAQFILNIRQNTTAHGIFSSIIFVPKIAAEFLKENKKSFLSFEIHLKQNKYTNPQDNGLKKEITNFIEKFLNDIRRIGLTYHLETTSKS